MDLTQVRAKIAAGELPSTDCDTTHLVIGGLERCVACEQPTTPANPAIECGYGHDRYIFHPDCYVMWEEALRGDASIDRISQTHSEGLPS